MVDWQPVEIRTHVGFTSVEAIIGAPVHPDAIAFHSSWLAGSVSSRHSGWPVLLMTSWNQDEVSNQVKGIREHVEVERADGLPFTVPVANTDSCVWFAIRNDTGQVVIQDEGRPDTVVAASLREFLDSL